MTDTDETPPTRERSKTDAATLKIGVGLIVVLALIGLVVAGTSKSKSSDRPCSSWRRRPRPR